ncbi:MAG: hypothetical protein IPK82_28790 [Polyangiaceae bacterium]|nr:hypothetical protein [Polyangiaceae bacterium]
MQSGMPMGGPPMGGPPMGGPPMGGPGPFGPGAPGGWAPLPQAPKKSNKVLKIVGCGCLSLVALVMGCGGFLLYQEEGKGLHVPDSEVASVTVYPDQPFDIQFKWEGFGWVFNNIWLVVEDGKKSGGQFQVKGAISCMGGQARDVDVNLTQRNVYNVESKGSDGFSAWLYLVDQYEYNSSRPISCTGKISPVSGSFTKAKIVVTQRQRPSDFFAF